LDVVVAGTGSSISGALAAPPGHAPEDFLVIAYPSPGEAGDLRSARATTVGVDGRYHLGNLPGGTFVLVVTTDLAPDEWLDDATRLRLIQANGTPVELEHGKRLFRDLKFTK
jgi:hypothetical protein